MGEEVLTDISRFVRFTSSSSPLRFQTGYVQKLCSEFCSFTKKRLTLLVVTSFISYNASLYSIECLMFA